MSTHVLTEQEVQALRLGGLVGGQAGAIVQHQPAQAVVQRSAEEWSKDRKELIKRTYCAGATDDEFDLFRTTCQRLQLSPEARQIFAVKRWNADAQCNVMQTQVSIDGFRLIAERTGRYAGQTPTEWCGQDGKWVDVWLENTPPFAARVGVLRDGFSQPLYRVAKYSAFVQLNRSKQPNAMWSKMADHMIAKVAEALALRAAFPNELSGVYTADEMGQADNDTEVKATVVDSRPVPEPGERGYNPTYNPAPDTKPDTRPARKADVNPAPVSAANAYKAPEVIAAEVPYIALKKHPQYGEGTTPISVFNDEELKSYIRSLMHIRDENQPKAKAGDADAKKFYAWASVQASKAYEWARAARGITSVVKGKEERDKQLSAAVNDGVYRDDEDLYTCLHPTLFSGQSIKTWDSPERLRDYRSWLLTGYNLEDKAARMERCERCLVKLAQIEQDRAEQALASQVPA